MKASRSWWLLGGPILLSVALGSLAGIGGYTFGYAEGFSYLKTDPEACVNCHIMQPQYDSWLRSSHQAAAICVDCHLPQSFIPKYIAKAENGWRHGKLFTTQTFKEPIEVQAAGREILQENCERCHAALVDSMTDFGHMTDSAPGSATGTARDGSKPNCVHCHATAGHGERASMGGPLRVHELEAHEDRKQLESMRSAQ